MSSIDDRAGAPPAWWSSAGASARTCFGGDELALLVRVDVSWVRWEPLIQEPEARRPWERHRSFLNALIRSDAGDSRNVAVRWAGADGRDRDWAVGPVPAEDTVDRVCDGLRDRALSVDPAPDMDRWACRVHLPPRPARIPAAHVCVDLRFARHFHSTWLYVTTSLWSVRPASEHHAPQRGGRTRDTPTTGGRVDFVSTDTEFRAISGDISALVERYLVRRVAWVFESGRFGKDDITRYEPPTFWVAACSSAIAHDRPCESVDLVARRALGVSDPGGSPLVSRHLLTPPHPDLCTDRPPEPAVELPITVLRRLVPRDDGGREQRPHYVLVPGRDATPEDQELAIQGIIHRIIDEDAAVAAELFERSTELDVNEALVAIYKEVAERGGMLWDQLAMHLPCAHGPRLERLRGHIGLLQVGLLQGIADLDYMAGQAAADASSIAALSHPDSPRRIEEAFRDLCGVDAAETSLSDAMRAGDTVARTQRWAGTLVEQVTSTRDMLTHLHDAIGKAFDESRVRDTDRVGRIGLALAGALALIALAGEGWAVLVERLTDTESWVQPVVVFAVPVATIVGLVWLVRRWMLRRVTGPDFERRYEQLRAYLAACRTERLDHLVARLSTEVEKAGDPIDTVGKRVAVDEEYHRRWNLVDRDLAVQCAAVIDDVLAVRPQLSDGSSDSLGDAVQDWLLTAMLASERPRAFWCYPVPRLLLLYAFYPILDRHLPESRRELPPLVSDADFVLALGVHLGCTRKDLDALSEWGSTRLATAASARDAVRLIDGTGLRPGLSRVQKDQVLDGMRADKWGGDAGDG